MTDSRILADVLHEYLSQSDEPLAVAYRERLAEHPSPSGEGEECITDVSDWLDGATAEDMLGVSTRTLQHYRDMGMLPYSKVGNKIYYKRSDLGAMIERHYKKGDAESERNCQKGNAESEQNYQKGGQR